MNGSIGVILITVAGAGVISLMGLASVRADRRSKAAKRAAVRMSDRVIQKPKVSAMSMAAEGTGNLSGNGGRDLAATSSTTR